MKTSDETILQEIRDNLIFLREHQHAIESFVEFRDLENEWRRYAVRSDALKKDLSKKRVDLEKELNIFIRSVKNVHKVLMGDVMYWMKQGYKTSEEFFPEFFKRVKKQDKHILKKSEEVAGKTLSHFEEVYRKWKIAKRRENDKQIRIQKMRKLRKLNNVLESLIDFVKQPVGSAV